MAVINFKNIKKVAEESQKTVNIDLGKFIDKVMDGIVIPIKVKSIEEAIKIKESFKHNDAEDKLTITYKPYSRTPKAFREMYAKEGLYRRGITEVTYFQIIETDKDTQKIERRKYRERLFNILIHLDMDYKNEDGVDMWTDAGLKKNDYNGLIDLFSGIIKYENHLDALDIIVDQVKSGVTDDATIGIQVMNANIRRMIDSIENEDERKVFIESLQNQIDKTREEALAMIEQKEKLDSKVEEKVETQGE